MNGSASGTRVHTAYAPPSVRTGHTSCYDPSRLGSSSVVGHGSRSGLAAGESLTGTQAAPRRPHLTLDTLTHDTLGTILYGEARKTLVDSMLRTAADPTFLNNQAFLFSFQAEKFPQSMSPLDRLEAAQAVMPVAVERIKYELSRPTATVIEVTSPLGDNTAGVDPSQVWRDPFATDTTALPTVTSVPTALATPMTIDPAPSSDDGMDWSLPSFPSSMDYGLLSAPESLFDETFTPQLDEDPVPTGFGSKYRARVTSEAEENANTISHAELQRLRAGH